MCVCMYVCVCVAIYVCKLLHNFMYVKFTYIIANIGIANNYNYIKKVLSL